MAGLSVSHVRQANGPVGRLAGTLLFLGSHAALVYAFCGPPASPSRVMLTGASACLAGLFLPRDLRHCRLLSHLAMLTLAALVSFLLVASVGSLAGVPPQQLARLSACGALPLAIGGTVCIQASRRGRREVGWCGLFWTLSLSALLTAWLVGS